MKGHRAETIFAFASGQIGRSALAVLRISGSEAGASLRALSGREPPPPRRASVRILRDSSGEILDEALVLWMPGPNSFTGEDCVELHLHGGPAIRAAVLASLSAMDDLREAEPGEFTRRAFLAGRLDLSEVEGLADLIDAETESQRRQALRQMKGGLSDRVEGWKSRLLDRLALLEASLDFADEDDIPDLAMQDLSNGIETIRVEIETLLAEARRGERIREGYRVAIAGPPNAGKSTLLNAVARREAAIVSPLAGTTRDVIEVRCDLDGLPVILADTAGLRDTEDQIERIGIARARAALREADLVLWLVPADDVSASLAPDEAASGAVLTVVTKADLASSAPAEEIAVSAVTGEGIDALLTELVGRLGGAEAGAPSLATRERHRTALREAASCLARASDALHKGAAELAAEDLRLALRAIGRLVGAVDVEDVLDRVFSQFCIGK